VRWPGLYLRKAEGRDSGETGRAARKARVCKRGERPLGRERRSAGEGGCIAWRGEVAQGRVRRNEWQGWVRRAKGKAKGGRSGGQRSVAQWAAQRTWRGGGEGVRKRGGEEPRGPRAGGQGARWHERRWARRAGAKGARRGGGGARRGTRRWAKLGAKPGADWGAGERWTQAGSAAQE
jgi:hypothetical protein